MEEKKETIGAKLNVLVCNLIDYVREDNRPLIFAVTQEIDEYFEQELDKAREEELEWILKNCSGGGNWRRIVNQRLSKLKTKE